MDSLQRNESLVLLQHFSKCCCPNITNLIFWEAFVSDAHPLSRNHDTVLANQEPVASLTRGHRTQGRRRPGHRGTTPYFRTATVELCSKLAASATAPSSWIKLPENLSVWVVRRVESPTWAFEVYDCSSGSPQMQWPPRRICCWKQAWHWTISLWLMQTLGATLREKKDENRSQTTIITPKMWGLCWGWGCWQDIELLECRGCCPTFWVKMIRPLIHSIVIDEENNLT